MFDYYDYIDDVWNISKKYIRKLEVLDKITNVFQYYFNNFSFYLLLMLYTNFFIK